MPDEFKTQFCRSVVIIINMLNRCFLTKGLGFQQIICKIWNPQSITSTNIIIPLVSLIDEIKTDCFAMAVI